MKWLLLLHVLGAVMFIGNVVTAAFWKIRAERSGELSHIHRTAKNVMIADYAFTLPGIVLLIGTGEMMAGQLGYSHADWNWMTVSLALFVLTGLLWAAVLIPNQRIMIRESERSLREGKLTPRYRKASRTWDNVGLLASLMPLAVLVLMVVKPF
ncbi:DUF2269 family protein [Paenibacillus flagellatus]|uniref:DUF2269 domain-containing protein n=1 Tax=Paenibacillus flagellatus TaxID=2211139 RepID=A0A2V5K7N5_9BACL|nr:DUF2269 family protein [Paenibacillus flagellatus]PYI55459.1 hypothetical protein DLM86_06915 [Paenibacillus flagellatus]